MEESVSEWSRQYVLVNVAALVCCHVSIVLVAPRQTEVILGVFGFGLRSTVQRDTPNNPPCRPETVHSYALLAILRQIMYSVAKRSTHRYG